jgi:hypothetical protein
VVIDTPQQQEKSFKRSFLEELQVVSESEDEHSRKKQRIEGNTKEISEEDIQVIEDTSEETQKKPAFTIEFLPSTVFDNIQNQEGAESSEIKPKNIFSEYDKMKDKNVEIKQILFPELDQDSSKSRLLSALDFEKGRLNLSLLEPNDQNLRSVDNYRATNFSVDLEQIHIVDKMDLLRQTREMVNRDVIQMTLGMNKLQKVNNQLKEQLRQEKVLTRTKQIRIDDLMKKLLRLRDNSKDEEPMQQIMSSKDNEILILKKKLHLTDLDHVQTPELQAIQREKDHLLNQMVHMNEQIKLYEQQIHILKQGSSSSQGSTSADSSDDLVKDLAELNFKEIELEKSKKEVSTQNDEIKILRDQIAERDKQLKIYQQAKAKIQEDYELLKTKLGGKFYLIGARHLLWDKIVEEITKIWDYIIIMDEESGLARKVDKDIKVAFQELGNRPETTTKIIKLLNSKSNEELSKKGIKNRTSMVMEIEKVFTKRNLIQQAQKQINSFTKKC